MDRPSSQGRPHMITAAVALTPKTALPATQPARRPRCVIVEDHRMFADLVALMCATAPDLPIDIVEIAPTVAAGIAACDTHKPDAVLLDLGLPDGSGIAVAEHVAAFLPYARVIVVTGQASTFVCPPHLSATIHAVVSTSDAFDALQVILAGIFARNGQRIGGRGRPADRRRLAGLLTRREREILAMIGHRVSSRAIAERLGLSIHTVNAHRKNIARKLNVPGSDLAFVAYDSRTRDPG